MTKLLFLLALATTQAPAQVPAPAAAPTEAKADAPIPDLPTLMHQVEANQQASEEMQKKYIYKASSQFDELNGKGDIKKTTTSLRETFWLNGVEVSRRLDKDGKPLTPDEAKKENERIDKRVAKITARRDKDAANGKVPKNDGAFVMPVGRYFQLSLFSNPRRELVAGRPTIVADFVGDPNAKAADPFENMVKDLAGTVWVDEQDKVIQHFDTHFVNNFKIGGGLLVSASKGTHFTYTNRKINDEVWLSDTVNGNGHIRFFLFLNIDGNFQTRCFDYRKFKATSTVLPNFTPVTP